MYCYVFLGKTLQKYKLVFTTENILGKSAFFPENIFCCENFMYTLYAH